MLQRTALVIGATGVLLGLGGAALAVSAGGGDAAPPPGGEEAAHLPVVTEFRMGGAEEGCVFDPARGGLVYDGLTVEASSAGVLELSFHVQRESLDDVLPGQVTTALVFEEGSLARTFDLVVPVSRQDYEAGYDECRWTAGGA